MNKDQDHPLVSWEATPVDVRNGKLTLMKAQVGPYRLDIHDVAGERGLLRIACWDVTGPDGRKVGEGVSDTAEEAQTAAEDCAHRAFVEFLRKDGTI